MKDKAIDFSNIDRAIQDMVAGLFPDVNTEALSEIIGDDEPTDDPRIVAEFVADVSDITLGEALAFLSEERTFEESDMLKIKKVISTLKAVLDDKSGTKHQGIPKDLGDLYEFDVEDKEDLDLSVEDKDFLKRLNTVTNKALQKAKK